MAATNRRMRLTNRGGYVVATVGLILVLGAVYALVLLLSLITGVSPS